MEKTKLKLKKETLSNLNKKELENVKGGRAEQAVKDVEVDFTITITLPMTITITCVTIYP